MDHCWHARKPEDHFQPQNDVLTHATTLVNRANVLSESSQTKRGTLRGSLYEILDEASLETPEDNGWTGAQLNGMGFLGVMTVF